MPPTIRTRDSAERGLARPKQWCGSAPGYDKHALINLDGVTLAAIVVNHRIRVWKTRPSR